MTGAWNRGRTGPAPNCWWQRVYGLAEARRYPAAVVDRAPVLLSALAAERSRDVIERQRPERRGDRQPEPQ